MVDHGGLLDSSLKGKYPLLAEANIPNFNWIGLIAYFTGAIVAYVSPWIAPIVGIVVACTTL